MQNIHSVIVLEANKQGLLNMMLVDREFYLLSRDELYKECIALSDQPRYIKRLILPNSRSLQARKEQIEHFLHRGFLCRQSTPEREDTYYSICCCLLRHRKMDKETRDYLLSSDVHIAPYCAGCDDGKNLGLIENIEFLLSRVRTRED